MSPSETSGVATETRLVTARLHERPEDSWTIEGALASGCYESLKQALTMTPEAIGQQIKGGFGAALTPLERSGDVFTWDPR